MQELKEHTERGQNITNTKLDWEYKRKVPEMASHNRRKKCTQMMM